ncbi:MAG: hypothetical protein LBD80_05860 [Tannerella sp.]|nr:hypothetical protein [Tannerella sp.]
MKNLIKISLLLTCILYLSGCSEDEKETFKPTVTKADVNFEAAGGNGYIDVSAKGNISASAEASWCTVSVSGQRINVTVTPNGDQMGRSTLITISADGETIAVPVNQYAPILVLDYTTLSFSFSGGTKEINAVKSSAPFQVSANADWISCSVSGQKISITLTETATPRFADIDVTMGNLVRKIQINQIMSYEDLLGEWTLKYRDNPTGVKVTFTQKTAGQSYVLSGIPVSPTASGACEVTWNASNAHLNLAGGQYLGVYGGEYVYMCIISEQGMFTWSSTATYEAAIDASASQMTYRFGNNGSWTGQTINGILPVFFTTATPSSASYNGQYYILQDVVLVK